MSFWGMTSCSLVDRHRYFRESLRHLSRFRKCHVPWSWNLQFCPCNWHLASKLRGVTSYKTVTTSSDFAEMTKCLSQSLIFECHITEYFDYFFYIFLSLISFHSCLLPYGCKILFVAIRNEHPSIHLWRCSHFRALASLIRRLHSSLFVALLLHPLVHSSCSASLWTTSAHLVLGLPTWLVVRKFPFINFFWNTFFFHPYYMTRPF